MRQRYLLFSAYVCCIAGIILLFALAKELPISHTNPDGSILIIGTVEEMTQRNGSVHLKVRYNHTVDVFVYQDLDQHTIQPNSSIRMRGTMQGTAFFPERIAVFSER